MTAHLAADFTRISVDTDQNGFKQDAVQRARDNADDIIRVIADTSALLKTLNKNRETATVPGSAVSVLLNSAESLGLVRRDGMIKSGLAFPVREKELKSTRELPLVNAELAMTTLKHVHDQAARAHAAAVYPDGYTPRQKPLYGFKWDSLVP